MEKKMAYLGHRKFLPHNHPFRRQKKSFNGQRELGSIPEPLSGEVVFEKTKDLDFQRGKINKKRNTLKEAPRVVGIGSLLFSSSPIESIFMLDIV